MAVYLGQKVHFSQQIAEHLVDVFGWLPHLTKERDPDVSSSAKVWTWTDYCQLLAFPQTRPSGQGAGNVHFSLTLVAWPSSSFPGSKLSWIMRTASKQQSHSFYFLWNSVCLLGAKQTHGGHPWGTHFSTGTILVKEKAEGDGVRSEMWRTAPASKIWCRREVGSKLCTQTLHY